MDLGDGRLRYVERGSYCLLSNMHYFGMCTSHIQGYTRYVAYSGEHDVSQNLADGQKR